MKNVLFALLLGVLMPAATKAFDQTGKTALGITGGWNFPVGAEKFKNEADPGAAFGLYLRRHLNQNWGVDTAYTRQEYNKICSCTSSNIYDVLGFYRVNGSDDVSPILGLGVGAVDNGAHQNLHLGVRARAGLEKAFTEQIALSFLVDYQRISKMPGANKGPQPSNIGTITPKLELSWYFGK
jgi:hypothetical protein